MIDKAYFIVSGFIMAYYLDEAGNEHVLKIYRAGEIVAGSSFMNARPSRYYLKIYRDTLVMEVTHAQMQIGYQTIPDMEELARLTVAGFENKEVLRDEMIRKGGEESVLHFYRANPELLPPGKIIKDHHIASYLHMSVNNLQHIRTFLIKKELLPNKKS
nr:cyclic nucleotide-binding domain-containing protein [Pedobacter nutrimenti]